MKPLQQARKKEVSKEDIFGRKNILKETGEIQSKKEI